MHQRAIQPVAHFFFRLAPGGFLGALVGFLLPRHDFEQPAAWFVIGERRAVGRVAKLPHQHHRIGLPIIEQDAHRMAAPNIQPPYGRAQRAIGDGVAHLGFSHCQKSTVVRLLFAQDFDLPALLSAHGIAPFAPRCFAANSTTNQSPCCKRTNRPCYNASMPELAIQASPHPVPLAPLAAPQMCYTLLNIRAVADGQQPLHCAFLVDVSQSMRIPVVDQALFRTLVQQGGAHETLVDGTPVWQLGSTPALGAQSTLAAVAGALGAVVSIPEYVSIIGVGEAAHVLAEAETDRATLRAATTQLSRLPTGATTHLSEGMARALAALEQGEGARNLFILTDGVTTDQEQCLLVARQAAAANVCITAIGLGSEAPDDLLLALATLTGGQALFVPKLRDLLPRLRHELERAHEQPLPDVSLLLAPGEGVEVRALTQVQPLLAALPLTAHQHMLAVTYTPRHSSTTLLLRCVAGEPTRRSRHLCSVVVQGQGAPTASVSIATRTYAQPPALLPTIARAAQQVAHWQQCQRALAAAAQGQLPEAQRLLEGVLTQLIAHGMPYRAAALRAAYAHLTEPQESPTRKEPLPIHHT